MRKHGVGDRAALQDLLGDLNDAAVARATSEVIRLANGRSGEGFVAVSADARKKLRSKEKRLAEAVGPLEYRRASGEAGIRAILDAFHAQKSARFASLGVPDPYAPDPSSAEPPAERAAP